MQTAGKVKCYYDTQGRPLLTKEFCHHWRKLKSKNKLMGWASPDCDLKFWYECVHRYKPLLSYRRFLDNLKTTNKMCLVWMDRCWCTTCESCNLLADEELVGLIKMHNYDSKFLVDNKDFVDNLINKKDIIKKNQWAIWSFVKNLGPEKLKDGTIIEPHKECLILNKELQTVDTLSSSSPINNFWRQMNEENAQGIISNCDESNKIYSFPKNNWNQNTDDHKYGLDYAKFNSNKEIINKQSEDYPNLNLKHKKSELDCETSFEDFECKYSPLTISLPLLRKEKSKDTTTKKTTEVKEKGKKFKVLFRIQKI